ncbi:MAG: hypothetical protein E7391_05015 [Ruminococcaceae bacterium]|nr:hypothetical protein [Oscillospiraceae bacterium]
MKKIISLVLCLVMLVSCFSFSAFAQDEISIIINGKKLTMDQSPIIVEGRTLVPLRAIFEALGAKVEWDDLSKTATGIKDGNEIKIQINNAVAKVNGKDVTLDVPAQIVNSRTLVPVRFISESLGLKVDWDDATKTVIITGGKIITFDDVESLTAEKDFQAGGGTGAKNIALTTEKDHTTGNGKSVKVSNRTSTSHRVKFMGDYGINANVGDTLTISAYVLVDEDSTIRMGTYTATGGKYSTSAKARSEKDAKKGEWTYIELTFKNDNSATMIGFDQVNGSNVSKEMYIDDIKIEVGKAAEPILENEYNLPYDVKKIEGKRPTPIVTGGKTYDDLIFYERTFKDPSEIKTSQQLFDALPKNPEKIADNNVMLSATLTGKEYASFEKIVVDDATVPFKEGIRATVTKIPEQPYHAQLVLPSLKEGTYKTGDNMLAVFYLRTIKGENDSGMGRVQLIVEQEVSPNAKALKEDVTTVQGAPWKKVYLPFIAKEGYGRLCVRLGYNVQTVEFGGYEILNYKDTVKYEDLPSDTQMTDYDKRDIFTKDEQWRKEAWARIENIRRGDINVIVKDKNGNVIENADVKVNMYDHEFKFGAPVKTTADNSQNANAHITLFNTGVNESSMKWVYLIDDGGEKAQADIDFAKKNGQKYFRGHALVWDRDYALTYDKETDKWIYNTSTPETLVRATLKGDKAEIDRLIKEHVENTVGKFKDYIDEWDVANEIMQHNLIRKTYGNEVLKQWFTWAKQVDPKAKMYINENGIIGVGDYTKYDNFRRVLDEMVAMDVPFDGIGLQAHIDGWSSMESIYDKLSGLASYGKELKITEFDVNKSLHMEDEEAEASMLRDLLIICYSIQNMDGFVMWNYKETGATSRRDGPIFNADWTLKLSGEQFLDLVYNKWWTQEEGKTDANGAFTTKGYYGDYLITATANGKSKTVDVKHYKGNTDTIEIVLD